jgi:RNA polymerase sigma factor (sigma-70 family)
MQAQLYVRLHAAWPAGGMVDAEDLVQEVAIAVWQAEEQCQSRGIAGTPGGWCYTVALRDMLDLLDSMRGRSDRGRLRRWAVTHAESIDAAVCMADARVDEEFARVEHRIDARIAAAAVPRLPLALRTAVVRRYGQGWALAAIGAESGISKSGAKLRLNRALARLRELVA